MGRVVVARKAMFTGRRQDKPCHARMGEFVMRRIFMVLCAFLVAPVLQAQDRVKVGPPPAWVTPVEAGPVRPDAGGISLRLLDMQTRIDDTGVHQFGHQIIKVTSPAALQAAGNLAVAWQPAFGSATIHRVQIHRDGAVIDIVNDGKSFNIIRRETGLESARLDGQLTAVMQVPDLRVGDEIEFSFTIDSQNPVLAGHAESQMLIDGGVTYDRLHIAYSWPKTKPMTLRVGDALPAGVRSEAGGFVSFVTDRSAFTAPVVPARAPLRYLDRTLMQVADFPDWNSVARLLTPLYDDAATLKPGSPIGMEADRISAASNDPLTRASGALNLVQRNVRYFADFQGLGGYKPPAADDVWAARTGDCKGKTVLLLALLRRLGIQAVPAVVSATRGDGLDKSLPMPMRFDHVLVKATIGGKTYWLDGTRPSDPPLEMLDAPPFKWSLPLVADTRAPVAIPYTGTRLAEIEWRLDLDARAGADKLAKATGTGVFRGDTAAGLAMNMSLVDAKKRDEILRKIWSERHDWVTIDTVSYDADQASGEVRIGFAGTGKMDWNRDGKGQYDQGYYEANKARIGYYLSPDRQDSDDKSIPVVVAPNYAVTHQTILLPDGGKGYYIDGQAIDETVGGVRYKRTVTLKGDRFDMSTITRAQPGEISIAEAKAADKQVDVIFAKQLFVHMPDQVQAAGKSSADPAGAASGGSAVAMKDAARLAKNGQLKEAIARIDEALAQDGRTADMLATRGGFNLELEDYDSADNDFDGALALDARHPVALWGKAEMLSYRDRPEDALILWDRLLLIEPDKAVNYEKRGEARFQAGKQDAALQDFDIALAKDPALGRARLIRVRILTNQGKQEQALTEAKTYVERFPEEATAHALLGNVLINQGRKDEAGAELDKALAIEPSAEVYLMRLSNGMSGNTAGQYADMLALIGLNAKANLPTAPLRSVVADKSRLQGLLDAYDKAPQPTDADRVGVAFARAYVEAAAGNPAPLDKLLDGETAKSPADIQLLNNSCWTRATLNIALDKALANCNAAIALRRESAFLDSRGFVQLRRGALPEAIKDYDEAIALRPKSAFSLYGRGVAKLRIGDKDGGANDLKAARTISKDIDRNFAEFGVTP
jgi:tetratricopeptide (TPR) repeat protein